VNSYTFFLNFKIEGKSEKGKKYLFKIFYKKKRKLKKYYREPKIKRYKEKQK
jgi:hypothetical protein